MVQKLRLDGGWPVHWSHGFALMVSILLMVAPACSGKKTASSSQKSGPSGDVQVTGTVSDDDPTEFTQADESVQIGGVNLTSSGLYEIKVYKVTRAGYVLALSKTSTTSNFDFTLAAATLLRISVTKPDGKVIEAVMPSPNGSAKAYVRVTSVTDIATKMLSIAVDKAKKGDVNMANAISNNVLPVVNLLRTAASILMVVSEQKRLNQPASAMDLSQITSAVVTESMKAMSTDPRSTSEVAMSMSKATYDGVFDSTIASASSGSPEILAFRSSSGLLSDSAYSALSSVPVAERAYQAYYNNYTAAASVEVAAQNQSSAEAQFQVSYSQCMYSSCTSDQTFTPMVQAPPVVTTTTTTTTDGTTTGGTTTGGTTTGGTTSGSTPPSGTTTGGTPTCLESPSTTCITGPQ